jgi:CRP-like cAMP-binding protein
MPPVSNQLLQLLPAPELTRVLGHAERVPLRAGQVLHHFRMPMEYVYFVENGLISVSARVERERFVQVWLIGSEGLVGAPAVLAGGATPLHRRTVQVGGEAFRIRTAEFCEAASRLPGLRTVVNRYLLMVLTQTSQAGACNAFHSLGQRLARWLLVARDALRSGDLPLTHSILAELLGVRRASVSDCLADMQREGIVTTRRGHIRIEAPAELSAKSCDCYGLIELEYQRYLATAENRPQFDRRLRRGASG